MSIALATGDTITGVAGSATSITYTITGDEIAAGADAFKVLAQGQLPSSIGTLYTAPASTEAIVKGIHLVNVTAGTVTASLALKGTAAANQILPPISILAGGFAVLGDDGWHVYDDQGRALGVGATGATGAAGADGADGTNTVIVQDEGTPLATAADTLDFVGAGVTASGVGATKTITIPGVADILDLATVETTATKVLAPDGAGGVEFRAETGGSGDVATDAIWDAAGDLAVGSGANTAAKLTAGSEDDVLTIVSGVPAWAAPSGGSSRPYLDRYSDPLDGTMGDDFTEASLNGRWARRTITSGMESYQQGDGTWLVADIASATQACQYYQACPSGDWEFTVKLRVTWTRGSGTPVFMYGMACLDSSGNGKGIVFYTDQSMYHATIASYIYSSYNRVMGYSYSAMSGHSIWFRVRKSGTTIFASHSEDGDVWSEEFGVTDSATWAEITIGRFLGTASGEERFAVDRFDRVA